jgi:predicted ATP-dependent protease
MNLETIVYKLQRGLDKRIQQLAISVTSGGVDSMETYKYIIGQINALEATKQEISNLLNEKEQNEGTIVDIKRNGKDPLTK